MEAGDSTVVSAHPRMVSRPRKEYIERKYGFRAYAVLPVEYQPKGEAMHTPRFEELIRKIVDRYKSVERATIAIRKVCDERKQTSSTSARMATIKDLKLILRNPNRYSAPPTDATNAPIAIPALNRLAFCEHKLRPRFDPDEYLARKFPRASTRTVIPTEYMPSDPATFSNLYKRLIKQIFDALKNLKLATFTIKAVCDERKHKSPKSKHECTLRDLEVVLENPTRFLYAYMTARSVSGPNPEPYPELPAPAFIEGENNNGADIDLGAIMQAENDAKSPEDAALARACHVNHMNGPGPIADDDRPFFAAAALASTLSVETSHKTRSGRPYNVNDESSIQAKALHKLVLDDIMKIAEETAYDDHGEISEDAHEELTAEMLVWMDFLNIPGEF